MNDSEIYEDSDVDDYKGPSPLTGFLVCVALGFFITVGFIWVMVKLWT